MAVGAVWMITAGVWMVSMSKLKEFFSDFAKHWILAILFVLVIAVFLTPIVGRFYDMAQARLTFLPARRVG